MLRGTILPSLSVSLHYMQCLTQLKIQGGLENPEMSGNLTLVREKPGRLWFACGVLLQLQ